MALLWDLIQQFQIQNRKNETYTLDERVEQLERDVQVLGQTLEILMKRLEETFGQDINYDGKIGDQ